MPVTATRHTVTIALPAVALCVIALTQRGDAWLFDTPLWELQNTATLLRTLATTVLAAATVWLLYWLLGLLLATRWPAHWLGALVGVTLTALLAVILRNPPNPNGLDLIGPLLAGALGVICGHLGRTLRRGLGFSAAALVVLGFIGLLLVSLALEDEPSLAPAEALTSEERVYLTRLVRSNSPRLLRPGQTNRLTLTDKDINGLLRWGLSLGSNERRAEVAIRSGLATVDVSFRVPGRRYLNAYASGSADVFFGNLSLDLETLSVGRLDAPRWLLGMLGPMLAGKINGDPRARALLDAVESARAERPDPGGDLWTAGAWRPTARRRVR